MHTQKKDSPDHCTTCNTKTVSGIANVKFRLMHCTDARSRTKHEFGRLDVDSCYMRTTRQEFDM
jgi:hypothetical protein